jgi:transcriptional regulator with XRE-family HTH domain
MKRTYMNVVGIEIRRLRRYFGWSQITLAHHLQRAGLNINRGTLAKVECGRVYVSDFELLYFARVLGIRVQRLFPDVPVADPLNDVLATLFVSPQRRVMRKRRRGASREPAKPSNEVDRYLK